MGNVQKEFYRTIIDNVLPNISIAFLILASDLSNENLKPMLEEYGDIITGTAGQLKDILSMHIDSQADACIQLLQVRR